MTCSDVELNTASEEELRSLFKTKFFNHYQLDKKDWAPFLRQRLKQMDYKVI